MAILPCPSCLPDTRKETPGDVNEQASTIRGWISRLFLRSGTGSVSHEARAAARFRDQRSRAKKRMLDSFALALEVREPQLGLISHAAHVATVAEYLADALEIDEGEQYLLRTAAYLSEVGLLTLPPGLTDRVGPLSPRELDHVRSQALASAEIANAAFHPRIVALIANQYSDYSELERTPLPARDQLLAGVLRVADVIATATWPRARQSVLTSHLRKNLLNEGAGTRFHPLAVRAALAFE